MRFPVAAKMALIKAGAKDGAPGSPTPLGGVSASAGLPRGARPDLDDQRLRSTIAASRLRAAASRRPCKSRAFFSAYDLARP
jgi:hypothetical protein